MAKEGEWRIAVLVDEAHNLVERARAMYSAGLDHGAFLTAQKSAPAAVRSALTQLSRAWSQAHRDQAKPYRVYDEIPKKLRIALQQACEGFIEHEGATGGVALDAATRAFFFDLLHFSRLAEAFGSHSLFDVILAAGANLALCNVVPGPFLENRFAAAPCAVLFSATLSPSHYYTGLVGLPDTTVALEVGSPFAAKQLRVQVAQHISTRYPDRSRSLAPIAAVMARQYREQPGNYLAFLSSYEYLEQVADELAGLDAGIDIWRQSRSMGEAARDAFLARYSEGGRGIGFAVLGGPFAEGIDLPGERLVGAFIATLGLPQVNPVNEQMKLRMQAAFGAGYDYAYLYPGLQKIVQAAGRVIRTPTDVGVLHLMDDRFALATVRELLPSWWKVD